MQQTIATPYQMGQILAAGRRRTGLTQTEAAARLGVSQSRISTLEADSGALTLNQLLALLGAYGLQLQVQDKGSFAATPTASALEW
ncbi:helix-turn-helix domain-containing protein [Caballeronia sp. SEWSISQ10-4 2]|uniref:helix-turn-helix domain-containing protein n=1 Tax=Caballeronia sp. SEWSISQ10-4 2 TaxID=2937438 RepID=UPI0026535079|nr:helix-turn-helix transcriptional regulator [Caballeronia sp. SEWSISQ10-4 2]MDN7177636.1 helix-turn-helix domain-containing protein [Caballeronia sp. SEWSISQ10-4 2]